MTYIEKLKNPKWQKKRLEIFNRDNFRCIECSSLDKTLHVHHGYYERGKEPWEYPDETLHTLCESCHELAEEIRRDIYLELGKLKPNDLKNYMLLI